MFNTESLDRIIERPAKIIKIDELIGVPGADAHAILEYEGIGGSHKDRPGALMLQQAIIRGDITETTRPAVFTTGSFGNSIGAICKAAKIGVTVFMPEGITKEREEMIRATGAQLIKTPADRELTEEDIAQGITPHQIWVAGAIRQTMEWQAADPAHRYVLNQSASPYNPIAFHPLARMVLARFNNGKPIDYIVIGSGTGATLAGFAQVFKKVSPHTKIIGVDVQQSPQTHAELYGYKLQHDPNGKIPGFGPGAASPILKGNIHLIDDVEKVDASEAMEEARRLVNTACPVGLSSAADVIAVRRVLARNPQARVITIFFDKADRYKSIGL